MYEFLDKKALIYNDFEKNNCWGFAEAMPYAIYGIFNGKCIYSNRSGAALLGLKEPVEVRGKYIKEFIPSVMLEKFEKTIREKEINREIAYPIFETKLIRADETVIDVEIAISSFVYKGNNIVYSIVRDVTTENRIKENLIENEKKYKTLLEMMPDAVFLISNSKIAYGNISAIRDLGCEKLEDIVGRRMEDFIIPCHSDKFSIDNFESDLENRRDIHDIEECYVRKSDGEIMPREISVKFIGNSEESDYLIMSRDISEKKHMEQLKKNVEKRSKALDEAGKYDKLRTKLFVNISHEFRTPLNVISSGIQLSSIVINEAPDSECRNKIIKYMGSMKHNCYRLIKLMNNLTDIAEIDTGYFRISPEECNIVEIIENISLSVKNYIENKGINLTFDTDSEEIIMVCDPDGIERIMLNLLSNALKFTEPPGSISVSVFGRSDSVFIHVKDTGIGIPKDKETIIFDKFQKVDECLAQSHEGCGIGLFLVKSLVEMHGGSIRLNSDYKNGSEFIVELPYNNCLNKKPSNKRRYCYENRLERINVEFSDIYFQ